MWNGSGSETQPRMIVGVAGGLVALLANWLPAGRATKVDRMSALRRE